MPTLGPKALKHVGSTLGCLQPQEFHLATSENVFQKPQRKLHKHMSCIERLPKRFAQVWTTATRLETRRAWMGIHRHRTLTWTLDQ